MAHVEIDETELMNYRTIAGVVQKMLSNPDARTKLLEAQKTINPNAVIPEIDAKKQVLGAVDEVRGELKTLRETVEAERAEIAREKTLAGLRAQYESGRGKARRAGYSVEGLAALEKFMEEKGIADHEIAMPAFERLNPPSAPVDASGSNRFDPFDTVKDGEDDMKLLLGGNEQQFMNKRIRETLTAVRSGSL